MKTKITDNWEVQLINDRGDTLTLKGELYADFFKEYDNKQLIIADVVGRSEQLKCFLEWYNDDPFGEIGAMSYNKAVKEYLKTL
jgi:hypothetical protein